MLMPYQILIDGYNLLFTAGFEGRSRGRGWLEQARQRLIKHLELHLPPEEHTRTLVVFDVSVDVLKARQRDLDNVRGEAVSVSSGIQVAFAFDFDEADDMLESLIRKHSSPKSLTVVSSDNRIRKCALARRAISIGSDDFLIRLERPINSSEAMRDDAATRSEVKLSDTEVQEWLREFGDNSGD
jgi:predicted RNA-binding protein with PIN domain